MFLDVSGQLVGGEEVAALKGFRDEVLDLEGFLVLAFLEF